MKNYVAQMGIYTKSGHIMGVEDYEFEALDDESAIEEALSKEHDMEEHYACVMVDCLQDENGNEINVYAKRKAK